MTCTLGSQLGRWRLALTSWSVAGALLAVAPCLHAQEATPSVAALRKEDAPIGAVRVFVSTDEHDLLLTVAQPGKERGIVRCYHQCSFWGLPGSYTLWATSCKRQVHYDTLWATSCELEILYETTLRVGARTAFRVSSGNADLQIAGSTAGIVGPIAIVGGGAFLGLKHYIGTQCNESNCPAPKDDLVPAVIIVSGLVATLVGWAIFSAAAPSVHPVDDKPAPLPPPRLRLGLLSLPHSGWGLGLSTPF
jgi:hypothetical protein